MFVKLQKSLFIAIMTALFLLVASPHAAAETTVCDGCTTGTYNGLSACVKSGSLHICKNNFPDGVFRNFLTVTYDTDQDSLLTQAQVNSITSLVIFDKNLSSLAGIGYFSNLTSFMCSNTSLTTLDLSANRNLTDIQCTANTLQTLVVPKDKLQFLQCSHNQLTELDLSGAQNLRQVICSYNQLTSINLDGAIVRDLYCNNNKLVSLDIGKQNYLQSLHCQSNNLSELDISKLTNLRILECSNNQIGELDLSAARHLQTLLVDGNKLSAIDLSSCPELVNATLGSQVSSSSAAIQTYPGTDECTIDLSPLVGTGSIGSIINIRISSIAAPVYTFDSATATINISNYISHLIYTYQPVTVSDKLSSPPCMSVSVVLSCLHTWTTPTCTTPSKCTGCGETTGDRAPHTMTPATATLPERCSVCGYYEDSAHPLEHVWVPASCTEPVHCQYCNATTGEALDHDYKKPPCGSGQRPQCTRCGNYYRYAELHEFDVVSCTLKQCKKCGAQEAIYPNHTWSEPTLFRPSRCIYCSATQGSSYLAQYTFIVFFPCIYALEFTASVWYLMDYKRERKY